MFYFSNLHIWQTFNALFIIRSLVKYIIETGSEFQLLQHFEAVASNDLLENVHADEVVYVNETGDEVISNTPIIVDGSKFETFIDAIVNLIVVIPVK